MRTQYLFERYIRLYHLISNFQTSKFDVWRHRFNNSSMRYRAHDRFFHPGQMYNIVYKDMKKNTMKNLLENKRQLM